MFNSIVMTHYAFNKFKKRCDEANTEIGFYMIGFLIQTPIVIDLIEFKYERRTSISIVGSPDFVGFIMSTLPPIFRILGTIHRHPGDTISPSSTDIEDFLRWRDNGSFFHIITNENCKKMRGYFIAEDNTIHSIDVIFRDMPEIKFTKTMLPGNIRIYYPPDIPNMIALPQISNRIPSILSKLYNPVEGHGSLFDTFRGIKRRRKGIIYVHLSHPKLVYPLMIICKNDERVRDIINLLKKFFEGNFIIEYDGENLPEDTKCKYLFGKDVFARRI